MTVQETLIDLRLRLNNVVDDLIVYLAKAWGYPELPGMPIVQDSAVAERAFRFSLPLHVAQTFSPPQNLIQALIGVIPKLSPVERVIYESKEDGYYNFYIQNFRNLYFLPNWLSEFLQIRLNFCLDITGLEMVREGAFLALLIYIQMLSFRIALYWYLTINPYTRPWVYFIAATDWIEETLAGLSPVILGVDLMPSLIISVVGKLADSLNHLVFTMPFLPSEGQRAKILINGEWQDILLFRYLPYLWYKHPIPDDLREFWYDERPDILLFMQKNYKHLDIEFYPNRILKEVYENQQLENLVSSSVFSDQIKISKDLTTQLISDSAFYIHQFTNYLAHYQEEFYNFSINYHDKLIF